MVFEAKAGKALALLVVLVLLALAGAFLAISALPYASLKSEMAPISLHGNTTLFTPALHDRIVLVLRGCAVVLVLTSAIAWFYRPQIAVYSGSLIDSSVIFFDSIRHEAADALRQGSRLHLLALAAILLVACAVRISFLFQPMRYDEAYTYTHYASTPFYLALSNYSGPNNHLLHTALVRISYLLFGDDPWSLRLPALIAGIMLVPATYVAIRSYSNKDAALLAAGLVAASSPLIEFSTNARGYTLLGLLFLIEFALVIQLPRWGGIAPWILFSIVSALGFYTVPTMLYPFGALVLWLFLSMLVDKPSIGRPLMARRLAMALVLTSILTVLLYLPVLIAWGPGAIIGNGFVAPKPWAQVVDSLPRSAAATWATWNVNLPGWIVALLVAGVATSLVFHGRISRSRVPVVIALLIWIFPVVLAQRVVPYGRVWLFLLPIYLGLAAAGLVYLWSRIAPLSSTVKMTLFPPLSLALTLLLSVTVVASQSVYWSEDTGTLRAAEPITQWMRDNLRPGDLLLSASPADGPLEYYFRRYNLRAEDHWYSVATSSERLDASRRLVVVVKEPEQSIDSLVTRLGPNRTRYGEPQLIQKYPGASLYELIAEEG